jgi:hypothetical protein
MKKNNGKVDILIEKNGLEQLSRINWERLNAAISDRLDRVRQDAPISISFSTLLKVAVTTAAAAIVLITVTLNIEKLTNIRRDKSRIVEVKFVESKGSASVEIQTASAGSQVAVDIETKRILAKCDIEILDKNGGPEESTTRAAWIIIGEPKRVYAENGANQDMMDIMYLF